MFDSVVSAGRVQAKTERRTTSPSERKKAWQQHDK